MNEPSTQNQTGLDPNAILVAEFNYIAQTAFQANEDRARVSNYYLVTSGAAVAAIVGARIEGTASQGVYLGFSALFVTLSLIGVLILLQLARLRRAWAESARAMDVLKEYYLAHCAEPDLSQAFAWRVSNIPPLNKRNSIAFLMALSVILIDSITLGAAAVYLFLATGSPVGDLRGLAIGAVTGLVFAGIQYYLYTRWLCR